MANKQFNWDDPRNLRERAWNSVKEFFGKEEAEHPLDPDTIAKETRSSTEDSEPSDLDHGERIHRRTEQRALNDRPNIWPG